MKEQVKTFFNKLINQFLVCGHKRGYKIVKEGNLYKLCRIINIYENENEAQKDLFNILYHQKNEFEILEDFDKKQI